MSDLHSKYQKLAAEYSKLKSQLPVLKRAVLDEQAIGEDLKEIVKEKDQTLRKSDQEIESLSFRNQQLTTRVSILQQELDNFALNAKKNKKWTVLGTTFREDKSQQRNSDYPSGHPELTSQASVIGEELQSKIEENARLHRQVHDAELEYQETVTKLEEKLCGLEEETSHHQQLLQSAALQSRSQLDQLQEDKATLEVKLQRQEQECDNAKEAVIEVESQLHDLKEKLSHQLDSAKSTIAAKLPFNDCECVEFNSLNIEAHNRQQQLQTRELVLQASGHLRDLIQGLSNFYTYSEQRSKAYPVDIDTDMLSDINKQLCQHLHENAQYLRPIEYSFKTFQDNLKDDVLVTLETVPDLCDFAAKWKNFVLYANKLLPYQLLSLEEECSVSSCTSTLETKNMELHAASKVFISCLSKVDTYISIIATQSSATCDHHSSSHAQMFELLAKALTDFHESTREMSKHYNAKVSLEHQLPTATQKLRVTDECIMSALVSLVTCTSKISAFMAGNLDFFRKALNDTSNGRKQTRTHPKVTTYRQKATQYMNLISRHSPETVPYKAAIHDRKTLVSSTESRDTLAQQVVNYQEKISKLEQDKEHWLLELQLVQMKLEKEQKKASSLEKKVSLLDARSSGSIEDNLERCADILRPEPVGAPSRPSSGSTAIDTSMLGTVETVTAGENDWDSREKLIRQHFSNRITELTRQLQIADTKALYFHAECRALHKQLQMKKQQSDSMQEYLSTSNQQVAQLKDELQTTTKSYEGQLSMMSEHLAAMNEKLTTQKDEIDLLKYQLQNSNKTNKKGRVK